VKLKREGLKVEVGDGRWGWQEKGMDAGKPSEAERGAIKDS